MHLLVMNKKETARVIQMKDRAKLDQAVNIAVASSRATSQVIAAVIRIAKNIGNKVHTDSSLNTLSKVESKIAKRDRIHFSEAVDYAESQSWIKVIDNRMVSKGSEWSPTVVYTVSKYTMGRPHRECPFTRFIYDLYICRSGTYAELLWVTLCIFF